MTPFSLTTVDGEEIYAWHILPLPTYLKHEDKLQAQNPGFSNDITNTVSFSLLRDDPKSRLIIYCNQSPFTPSVLRPSLQRVLTGNLKFTA